MAYEKQEPAINPVSEPKQILPQSGLQMRTQPHQPFDCSLMTDHEPGDQLNQAQLLTHRI